MAISLTCESCDAQLKVKDALAGKRVKCPHCGKAVSVSAPAPAMAGQPKSGLAPPAKTSLAAAKPSVSPPATPNGILALSCPECDRKFKVKSDKAGKKLKCPECGHVVTAPSAPPPANDIDDEGDWIDITEAYIPPANEFANKGTVSGDWGQEILEDLEVPEEMQEEIRDTLTKNEQIIWSDRPQVPILLARAKKQRIVGIFVAILAPLILGGMATFLFLQEGAGPKVGGGVCIFMALAFFAGGIFLIGSPGRVLRNAGKRSVYMLTNRRLLIHPGTGMQMATNQSGTQTAVTMEAESAGVQTFTGLDLMRMSREEEKDFADAGELVFGASLFDHPAGSRMTALADVANIEKKVREKLIDPVVDKLLRGELKLKEFGQSTKKEEKDDAEVLPPDGNIKSFMGKETDKLDEEGNVKSFRSNLEKELKKAPEDLLEKVEAELTKGEKILWVGEPEGKTQGRGMLGALTGSAERKEPDYHMYAITNRRVLLWCTKGTKVANQTTFGSRPRGPFSYYPPGLLNAGLEDDKRIAKGGSIIFKIVKVKIVTESRNTGAGMGHGRHGRHGGHHRGPWRPGKGGTTTSVRYENHYFGILRVRNVQAVARLLFDTLIRPCKG